jgi:putative ABC transport system permease protein
MNLLLRSAVRVWTRRPAGPALVALGVLAATLSAAGADLALAGAADAERLDDERELGDTLARIRTPGGYTVDEAVLADLQGAIADEAPQRGPADERLPVYLAREATVTTTGEEARTSSGWRILGLPEPTLASLDLPVPEEGTALVDPGPRQLPDDSVRVRAQAAPREEIRLTQGFQGQLSRTVQTAGGYQHADADDYVFEANVTSGAQRIEAYVATADNETDFDLEAEAPAGATWLDDNGTVAQPQQPNLTLADPEGGNWTFRVHAKFARDEPFRLQVVEVFDGRDARTLGRLLGGEGFRAVGAQLGLTRLASLDLQLEDRDLSTLGPAPGGLIVLELDQLRAQLDLENRATGLLVRAAPGEDPLAGLPSDQHAVLDDQVDRTRQQVDALDPARGLSVAADADRLADQRDQRLDSTAALLFVAVPAVVLAGVLLATWAAGLHTRRLKTETMVLAGLGQARRRSWTLVGLHLGPAFLLGTLAALLASPLVAEAIAEGLGLTTTTTPTPSLGTLALPALALVPVAGNAYASLRHAVKGVDPRTGRRPRSRTGRWLGAGAGGLAAVACLAYAAVTSDPARAFIAAAAGAAAIAWFVHWTPLWDALLGARSLVVDALGFFRTRSTHGALALAAGAAALVVAALVAGVGLSQAAQPDVQAESGGYQVVAQTPANVNSYASLEPTGDAGRTVLDQSVGAEFLMRVSGTDLHDASVGDEDTIYGIDSSFAQRQRHPVRSLDPATPEPVREVADSREKALVTTGLVGQVDDGEITIQGTQGELTYEVVGVLETRLLEGVYISKEALPAQFNQIAGEQRIRLPADVDPDGYAAALQTAFREEALTARTAETLAEERLDGQRRAGRTLQGVAAVGGATLLGLVGLLGFRARAERRSSDAVLAALGARPREIAAGIATETVLPIGVGAAAGLAVGLPWVSRLTGITGLAFPLAPIDVAAVATIALAVTLVAVLLALVVGAAIGAVAARRVDQGTLRQID